MSADEDPFASLAEDSTTHPTARAGKKQDAFDDLLGDDSEDAPAARLPPPSTEEAPSLELPSEVTEDKAPTAPSAAPELDLDLDLDLDVVAPPAASSPTATSAPAPAPAAAAAAAPSPAHPYSSDEQPGSPFTDFLPLGETVNTLAPDASIIDDIVPAGSDEATKPPASGIESESAESEPAPTSGADLPTTDNLFSAEETIEGGHDFSFDDDLHETRAGVEEANALEHAPPPTPPPPPPPGDAGVRPDAAALAALPIEHAAAAEEEEEEQQQPEKQPQPGPTDSLFDDVEEGGPGEGGFIVDAEEEEKEGDTLASAEAEIVLNASEEQPAYTADDAQDSNALFDGGQGHEFDLNDATLAAAEPVEEKADAPLDVQESEQQQQQEAKPADIDALFGDEEGRGDFSFGDEGEKIAGVDLEPEQQQQQLDDVDASATMTAAAPTDDLFDLGGDVADDPFGGLPDTPITASATATSPFDDIADEIESTPAPVPGSEAATAPTKAAELSFDAVEHDAVAAGAFDLEPESTPKLPTVPVAPAPPKRTVSTNPYATAVPKPTTTTTSNPYATTPSPYALGTGGGPGYPAPANPYGLSAASSPNPYTVGAVTSPNLYGLSSPNPYAVPAASQNSSGVAASSNSYFPSAAAAATTSPYAAAQQQPKKPPPAPFVRPTTQTYTAYDPPMMPAIPVVRKVAPPLVSPWHTSSASPYASAAGSPSTVFPPPPSVSAPPPAAAPPPPKRADSGSSYAPPPLRRASPAVGGGAAIPPPPRPSSGLRNAFSPPPLASLPPHISSAASAAGGAVPPPAARPPPPRMATAPAVPPSGAKPAPLPAPAAPPLATSNQSRELLDDFDPEGGAGDENFSDDEEEVLREEFHAHGEDGDQYHQRPQQQASQVDAEPAAAATYERQPPSSTRSSIDMLRAGADEGYSSRMSMESDDGARAAYRSSAATAPPLRASTLPDARSVVSPPPQAPPPRPSSTLSNSSSSRYAPPPAPLTGNNNNSPYTAYGQPPAPLLSKTPPPPRPSSAANSYSPYAMTAAVGAAGAGVAAAASSFSSPQSVYSPGRQTTGLPPQQQPYTHARTASYPSPQAAHIPIRPQQPTAYAPQDSFTLADDPLGRASEKFKRVPIFSFGFGGKICVAYPILGTGRGAYGGGVLNEAAVEGDGRTVWVKPLNEIVPESALKASTTPFPGPTFLDPATPKSTAGAATKKAAVLAYLDARATETEHSLGWLRGKGDDRRFRAEEGKAVLMRLLAVMVANEGRLMGSSKVEEEVRAVLLPTLPALSASPMASSSGVGVPSIPIVPQPSSSTANAIYSTSPSAAQMSGFSSGRSSLDFASSSLAPSAAARSASLDRLSALLLRGEKKLAVQYALGERLWAHAMVISSCLDKATWGEVVRAFAKAELGGVEDGGKQRDALRLTYEMFAGSGSSPLVPRGVPDTAALAASVPQPTSVETLANWREVIAMLISNRSLNDTEALIALGDALVAQGWIGAGHCCYLLSSHPPPLDSLSPPTAPSRVQLYGAVSPSTLNGTIDIDGILLTEVLEYALSLVPVLKGQEPFAGIPSLQAYKLWHAMTLIETGENALAQRYCEAVASSLKMNRVGGSPYHTLPFLNQLRELSERLAGTTQDKSGSWMSRAVSKPTLDGFGTWFEGRLTKFVAGEGPPSEDRTSFGAGTGVGNGPIAPAATSTGQDGSTSAPAVAIGPFSHFNAISPAGSLPVQSLNNNQNLGRAASSAAIYQGAQPPVDYPPQRSGSAAGPRSATFGMQPIDRSTSAMDFNRPSSMQPPQASAAAGPYSTGYAQTGLDAGGEYNSNPYGHSTDSSIYSTSTTSYDDQVPSAHSTAPQTASAANTENSGAWWGSSPAPAVDDDNVTPAATYSEQPLWGAPSVPADDGSATAEQREGDNNAWGSSSRAAAANDDDDDDEDDLGLGNSSNKSKKAKAAVATASGGASPPASAAAASAKTAVKAAQEEANAAVKADEANSKNKDVKPAASTGWLGRLWGSKKEDTPSKEPAKAAPIKAKLGEESAFYYDKELKRWVNKKVGAETEAPKPPPPPPSRAASATPSGSTRPPSPPGSAMSTPPTSARAPDGAFPPRGSPIAPPPGSRGSPIAPPPGPRAPPAASLPGSSSSSPAPPPPGAAAGAAGRAASVPLPRGPAPDLTAELLASTPTSRGPTPTGSMATRKKAIRSRYVDVFEQQK